MYIKYLLAVLTISSFIISGCNKNEENKDATSANTETKQVATKKEEVKQNNTVNISSESVKLYKIESNKVVEKEFRKNINTTGVIKPTENSLFKVYSVASGKITSANVNVGDTVYKNQVLGSVQNTEIVKIYANFIHEFHGNEVLIRQAKLKLDLARKNFEREQKLLLEGISSRKEYLQTKTDMELSEAELQGLEEHNVHLKNETQALLSQYNVTLDSNRFEKINSNSPIKANESGIVIKKSITVGSMVNPETILYEIADLKKVLLEASIYASDQSIVKTGQKVEFESESLPNKKFYGEISFIDPNINSETKTFTARIIINNPKLELKSGMFGKVTIIGKSMYTKPFIVENSLQTNGDENFVFLDLGNGKYEKKLVSIDQKYEKGYLISQGLKKDDVVVTQGAFTLKAEILKAQYAEEE